MSIIYNINISKITSYYPIFYNPYYIKNVYSAITSKGIIFEQHYSNNWDDLAMTVKNNFSNISYDRFPLNNSNFPAIQQYIKLIKYKPIEY
jgi:hypothetical protein